MANVKRVKVTADNTDPQPAGRRCGITVTLTVAHEENSIPKNF